MYKNKKGISDVVSTVLIILLVVAAIAIVGAIVLNGVNKGAKSVDATVLCQELDVKATRCTLSAGAGSVVVQRGAAGLTTPVNSINVIYSQIPAGTTVAASITVPVNTFNTVGSTITTGTPTAAGSGQTIKSAKISPVITLTDGTSYTCPLSAEVVCS